MVSSCSNLSSSHSPAWIKWEVNRWVATRSRMHTYQRITEHRSHADHYRHTSRLRTSTRRPARERCDMSAIPRIALVSVASATAIGLIVPIGVAPPATAAPCAQTASAPAPNTPAAPSAGGPTLTLPWPFEHLPIGRKPLVADEHAPLPRLGPLPGFSTLRAAARPSGGDTLAQSSRHGQPTAPER